ncbi:MAG: hypothetical protein K2U26_07780 [Cyclobacteriaceae bacterium]|nr:hypothetical protein [Cyclobacteriaceae bacterium]
MKGRNRVFRIMAITFAAAMIWLTYDISSKTTFPGKKTKKENPSIADSLRALPTPDSTSSAKSTIHQP